MSANQFCPIDPHPCPQLLRYRLLEDRFGNRRCTRNASISFQLQAFVLLWCSFVNQNFPPKLAAHLADEVHNARRRYRKRLARCQKKFSEKAVHDLRIETRRILALLDLLEALHFEQPVAKLRKTFKKRLDAFDDLRDTHVQRVLLKPLWRKFPEARAFNKHLCKCEKRLERKMSREIKTTKYGRLNRKLKEIEKALRKCASTPSAIGSANQAQILLGAAFRRVAILRRQIQRNKPPTIHRMRVAFKRFRYTAELLQPFLPQFTPQRLERMKDFQGVAGDIQNVSVLLARIEKETKNGDLTADCVKPLREELLRQERRAINSLMERMDELKDFEPEQPEAFSTKPEK